MLKMCFAEKTILCPCDAPEWSNFTKFFAYKKKAVQPIFQTAKCSVKRTIEQKATDRIYFFNNAAKGL